MPSEFRSSSAKISLIAILAFIFGFSAAALWLRKGVTTEKVAETNRDERCKSAFDSIRNEGADSIYFDADTFAAYKDNGRSLGGYYGILKALGEPSLMSPANGVDEVYRFTWIRSFGNPVTVRAWRCGGIHFVTAETLNQHGPDMLKMPRRLSPVEWSELSDAVKGSRFWELETVKDISAGFDGAEWIVEGSSFGHFHFVDRWSDAEPSYKAVGIYMLKISGLDITDSQVKEY